MSWQQYIDSSLVGTGHVDKAVIISVAGDSTWAGTPGFTLSDPEMKALVTVLSDKAAQDKAYAEGFHVAGERYVLVKVEDRSIYARQGRTGVAIAKTKQAILIGHHSETQISGNTTSVVEALADYLIKVGY